MSGVLQSLENSSAVFTRKIELPARARIEIVRDDTVDLRTKWLVGSCKGLAVGVVNSQRKVVPELHFRLVCKSPSSMESAWYRVVLVVEANDCVSR